MTNFPFGVSSFGNVLTGGVPVIPASLPSADPSVPPAFFVSGDGSDNNDGLTPLTPLATIAAAHALATTNCNQIIYLLGTQTSSKCAAAVVWSKNRTHLVGMCAPIGTSARARLSATAVFTPMVTVSGQGCIFQNFEIFHGQTSATGAAVCWSDTGGRNYYNRVHFGGGGDATQAADASCRSLLLSGNTGENLFEGCTIGLDTIAQVAASASIEITGGSPRNRFMNCLIQNYTTANAPLFLKIGVGGIDRYLQFINCIFSNSIVGGGTAMAQAFSLSDSAGGLIYLHLSAVQGPTALCTVNSNVLFGDNAAAAATGQRLVKLTG